MKKLNLLICLFLIITGLSATAREYKYQTVNGDLMKTRIYTLDNGLTVYLSVNKVEPRIQTYIAVRTGSRNDPAETTGLAHYLEHLMFKGTKNFGTSNAAKEAPFLNDIEKRYEVYRTLKDPDERKKCYHEIDSVSQLAAQYFIPNEYDKLMSSIGGKGTNAYTSNDVTCYIEDIPSNEIENWAKIQSDRFRNMVIRGFHTELEAVYEEFNIGLGDDNQKLFAALSAMLFPGHPYGTQTTIGTQEHLKNPSIVNIKNYFKRYYVPNNVAICMAGDFDPDAVMAIIDKYFGSWEPNPNLSQPEYAPIKKRTTPADTTVVGQESERIYVAWNFEKAASLQKDTLDVISDMLSNGKAGLFDLDLDQQMKWLGGGVFTLPLAEYSGFVIAGLPKEGQTLDEIKSLILGEIDKLKKGDFDENLIKAVINNRKLNFYTTIESNRGRADMFVDAFINRAEWSDMVGSLDRISGMTKQQIVDFANRHFKDNYIAVYKRQGEDTSAKKIDKPQITAIPTNRDMQSDFMKEIANSKTTAIQPKFVDFEKDFTKGLTKNKLPIVHVKNNENGRFSLTYMFDCGQESNNWLSYASDYFDYLGTDKMTATQLKQKFYELACSYGIATSGETVKIYLYGLSENMTKAMTLLEDFLTNAKVDKEAFDNYVSLVEKSCANQKLNQQANFSYLMHYGMYGPYNSKRNIPTPEELKKTDPQNLIDMIKAFKNYKHEVLYYGPMEMKELAAAIDKYHKTAKKLADVPQNKPYKMETTDKNEVCIAPYNAKNIYMVQFHNENRPLNIDNMPVISLFNEYYGGGMNTVVFQELREARGLAYSAFASYVTPMNRNEKEYAFTYIISQNDKMMDCIKTFNSIIDEMPKSEKAFELAKQALIKRLETQRTVKDGILNAYIKAKHLGINFDLNKKIYETVPSLTIVDVANFEKETMANKPYRYIILGDETQLDMKSLEKIGPVKRLTTEEIFGY